MPWLLVHQHIPIEGQVCTVEAQPGSRARNDEIIRVCEAQDLAGDLIDHVGIGALGGKQRHVALELGAHGLKALDLKLQQG